MKDQIKKMKQELKEIASEIKNKKNQRKNKEVTNGSGCVPGLLELKTVFRHKHVAYCLTRGRKLEQCDSGVGLNMKWIEWIAASMNPESKQKLYIVVSDKLSPSQQAVQGGHALADFLKKNPHTQWSNGHLVYLKHPPAHDGNMRPYSCTLKCGINQYGEFLEPDADNKITAYAVFGPDVENALKGHKLV